MIRILGAVIIGAVFCMIPHQSNATYPAVIYPVVKVVTANSSTSTSVAASSTSAGAAAVGGFIGVVAVATVWCGLNQPKRNWKRDTYVDGRHDTYPTNNYRKTGCIVRKAPRDPKPVSVRG